MILPVCLALLTPAAPRPPAPARPKLVVVITVDQLRADYLDRWKSQLTGGLFQLVTEGAVFADGYQDHAVTETAPGHSTILSGLWPAHTGIIRNVEGVQDSLAPLLGTTGPGASPRRFRGTTLVDWLKASDPTARVLSVSRKDRGAILPIGQSKQQVFWYQSGLFTTSRYYADTLPTWVQGFNARRLPFNAVRLGRRGRSTDLLAVSLSTTDAIGHAFGPDSREIHDQVLRLDRYLAWFLTRLTDRVGRDNLVVVLTADHGVTSYPERTRAKTGGAAYRVALDTVITAVNRDLDRVAGAGGPAREWLEFDTGMLLLRDNGRLAGLGIKTDSILEALTARIVRVQGVARVTKPADLSRADTASDPVARRWIHHLPPDAGVVLTVTLQPGSVWDIPNLLIAMHGQPSEDDAHVPIVFWGRGVRHGSFAGRMNTVDIAPTLGALLGVTPLSLIDGHARTEALGPRN